jgi:hypothetical protein
MKLTGNTFGDNETPSSKLAASAALEEILKRISKPLKNDIATALADCGIEIENETIKIRYNRNGLLISVSTLEGC